LLAHASRGDRAPSSPSRPVPAPLRARERLARGSPQRPERLPGRSRRAAGDAQQAERRLLRLLAAELGRMTMREWLRATVADLFRVDLASLPEPLTPSRLRAELSGQHLERARLSDASPRSTARGQEGRERLVQKGGSSK